MQGKGWRYGGAVYAPIKRPVLGRVKLNSGAYPALQVGAGGPPNKAALLKNVLYCYLTIPPQSGT